MKCNLIATVNLIDSTESLYLKWLFRDITPIEARDMILEPLTWVSP